MKRNLSQGALATRQQRSNASKYIIIAMFLIFGLVSREFTVRLLSNENDRSMISASSAEALSKSISEYDSETGFTQSILVKSNSPIFSMQSKFQFIQVHESEHWGKILVLDGVTQLTERDGDSYNEMMAHVPLFQHSNPKKVLVLGGGDGYIVSEILKHASVEWIDHVDLDVEVINTCKKFFKWGQAWDDPRVHLHIEDGAKFVKSASPGAYDVIIQDSSDPWTWDSKTGELVSLPSSTLYAPDHFVNMYNALSNDGILNIQAETMQIPTDFAGAVEWRKNALKTGFNRARYGTITTATYPTGQLGFLLCEKTGKDPLNTEQRFRIMAASGLKTTYYHPRLQKSAFDLPLWAEERMYGSLR